MPTEEEIKQQEEEARKAAEAAKAAGDPPPEGTKLDAQGNVQVLSPKAFKRIKDEARAKGEREAMLKMAKEHGFGTVEEMQAAINRGKAPAKPNGGGNGGKKPEQQQQQQRQGGAPAPEGMSRRARESYERKTAQLAEENDKLKRRAAHNDKKYRRALKDLENKDTEIALRALCAQSGITEVDYAIHLFNQEVDRLDESSLEKFDEKKFFADLGDKKPFLRGEVMVPAGAQTTEKKPPAAPPPGTVTREQTNAGAFDARTATPEQAKKRLEQLGITPGVPHASVTKLPGPQA